MVSNFKLIAMIFSNIKKQVAFTTLLVSMLSCEVIVDVEMPEFEPSLVINCMISPDTSVFAELSSDKFILDDSWNYDIVNSANINLYENDNLIGKLSQTNNGSFYKLNYRPKPGNTYRLTAEKSGFESISAQTTLPVDHSVIAIKELKTRTHTTEYDSYDVYNLTYEIDDPTGADYYEVRLESYYPSAGYWYYDYDLNQDVFVESEGYWNNIYYWELGADFNEFEDFEIYEYFSDQNFDGKKTEIHIEFDVYENYDGSSKSDTTKYRLKVNKLSKDYYHYYISRELQEYTGDSPFAEPVPVYNNVQNGYGIFGGYSTTYHDFEVTDGKIIP